MSPACKKHPTSIHATKIIFYIFTAVPTSYLDLCGILVNLSKHVSFLWLFEELVENNKYVNQTNVKNITNYGYFIICEDSYNVIFMLNSLQSKRIKYVFIVSFLVYYITHILVLSHSHYKYYHISLSYSYIYLDILL